MLEKMWQEDLQGHAIFIMITGVDAGMGGHAGMITAVNFVVEVILRTSARLPLIRPPVPSDCLGQQT